MCTFTTATECQPNSSQQICHIYISKALKGDSVSFVVLKCTGDVPCPAIDYCIVFLRELRIKIKELSNVLFTLGNLLYLTF